MAMDANTEMVAPPSTHCGIVVRSAENFGTNPASRIIPAASPNTTRFTTFVVATIPTFWLNVAVGNPPKKEPKIFVIPYPMIPPESSLSVGSLSNPPPLVAERSPMACTELIMKRITRVITADVSNFIPTYIGLGI